MPVVQMLSLSIIGTPSSGPSLPDAALASAALASAKALSPVTVTKAFTLSSTFSMRLKTASVSSVDEISRAARRSAASWMVRS